MFKQLILPLAGVAIFIIFVGVLVKNPSKLGIQMPPTGTQKPSQKEVKVEGKTIKVTVVDTNETRAKGLSGTTSLEENSGMLFIFDSKDVIPTFWMKDMKIGIDIIWINDDKIVQIDKNLAAPAEGTTDDKLRLYKPLTKIDYVLEVNSGFSDKNGFKVGSEVSIP